MRRTVAIAVTLLLGGSLAGCGKHPGSYTATTGSDKSGTDVSALIAAADSNWEKRVDEANLKVALDSYAAAAAADPKNRHALSQLTRGWYFWGDTFATDKDVKIERWAKSIEYGTQCIGLNAKIAAAIEGGAKEKDAASHAIEADVPCLFWTATSLGKWAKIQGIARALKWLGTVKAYVGKAEELDPDYYHFGPDRYWGAYYAVLPSFAGQDLDKSAEKFETSIAGAPYYLPTRVLRAEILAVGLQDVAMFDADLLHVMNADPDANPEAAVTPENIKDQEKAREIFALRAELFDRKTLEAAGPAPVAPEPMADKPMADKPMPEEPVPEEDMEEADESTGHGATRPDPEPAVEEEG